MSLETLRRMFAMHPPPAPSVRTAILVDVANVVSLFSRHDHAPSFIRLREHLRGYGTTGFCDAFVPPRTPDDTIAGLWNAGFEVIACPMGSKDKDAVDEKIRMRALRYLYTTGVDRIVIVSRDADFRPLLPVGADLGKRVEMAGIREEELAHLAGADPPVLLENSRQLDRYLYAIRLVRDRRVAGGEPDAAFMVHLASLVKRELTAHKGGLEPHTLGERIKSRLLAKWGPAYASQDVTMGIRALSRGNMFWHNGPLVRMRPHETLWQRVP